MILVYQQIEQKKQSEQILKILKLNNDEINDQQNHHQIDQIHYNIEEFHRHQTYYK
jgi:hypothetical protein